jgi:HEAT repeat protein
MATAALCSLAQGTSPESARKVVESLMVPLVSLIDDHNIATRSYTLKTLEYVGPLQYEQLKTLAPALLSRLDDPGNEVREKAAKCLGRLELTADDEDALDAWESLLKQILATMLIHIESPEINLRFALIESIGSLGKKYPKVYRAALDESTISTDLKRKLP